MLGDPEGYFVNFREIEADEYFPGRDLQDPCRIWEAVWKFERTPAGLVAESPYGSQDFYLGCCFCWWPLNLLSQDPGSCQDPMLESRNQWWKGTSALLPCSSVRKHRDRLRQEGTFR